MPIHFMSRNTQFLSLIYLGYWSESGKHCASRVNAYSVTIGTIDASSQVYSIKAKIPTPKATVLNNN